MVVSQTEIPGVLLIESTKFGDERGYFSETYRHAALAEAGFDRAFVQDNEACSSTLFTVRGLHFQKGEMAQDKLIRVTQGAVLDVAVDIRPGSTTFGRHVAVELSAENRRQLLVPRGFAHGYQTLSTQSYVIYKVSTYYAPDSEGGLLWCDQALNIPWRAGPTEAVVNRRDAAWPNLAELFDP